MKIAHLGHTAGAGGIAAAIRQSCLALRRAGCDVMAIGNGGDTTALEEAGVSVIEVDWRHRPLAMSATWKRVRSALRRFRPSICHCHARVPSLMCALSGYPPDVYQIHSSSIRHRGSVIDRDWVRPWFPMGRHIVVLNQEAEQWAVDNLNRCPTQVHQVHHGIDCHHFRPPSYAERSLARSHYHLQENEFAIVFVGRFHKVKQPEQVLALASHLSQDGSGDIKVRMIGAGPMLPELQAAVESGNLSGVCRIFPWSDPRLAYWASDLIVMPSSVEGFGLVAAEAMACGSVVLRSRTGGFESMIEEGACGFGYCGGVDEFLVAVGKALDRRHQFHEIGEAARRKIVSSLSEDRHAAELIKLYKSIMLL